MMALVCKNTCAFTCLTLKQLIFHAVRPSVYPSIRLSFHPSVVRREVAVIYYMHISVHHYSVTCDAGDQSSRCCLKLWSLISAMNNSSPWAEQFEDALRKVHSSRSALLDQMARDRNCIQEELAEFINAVTRLDMLSTAIMSELLSNQTALAKYKLLLNEAKMKIASLEAETSVVRRAESESSRRGQPSLPSSQPSLPSDPSQSSGQGQLSLLGV